MNLPILTTNPAVLSSRLQARLTRAEWVTLGGVILVACYFLLQVAQGRPVQIDLVFYVRAAHEERHLFYYAFWILPAFNLLGLFSPLAQATIFYALSIIGVIFACRVFVGRFTVVLSSFIMLWILLCGQFTGIAVGGVALVWWAALNRRGVLLGVGLLLALVKYHTFAPLVLTVWLLAHVPLRVQARAGVVLGVALGVSLVIYGWWPLAVMAFVFESAPPDQQTTFTLWRWLGPLALLVWIPVVVLPLSRERRLVAVVCASALGLPYFQVADYLLLLVMLHRRWVLILNIGFLYLFYAPALQVLPLIVLVKFGLVLVAHIREGNQILVTNE